MYDKNLIFVRVIFYMLLIPIINPQQFIKLSIHISIVINDTVSASVIQ